MSSLSSTWAETALRVSAAGATGTSTRRARPGEARAGGAARAHNDGDWGADLEVCGALGNEDLGEVALLLDLVADGGLVRLHLGDDVAGADLVPFRLEPLGDGAGRHGLREGGGPR